MLSSNQMDYSVLFYVLYFGENEFSECIESIFREMPTLNKTVVCKPYKPMYLAHKACYEYFQNSTHDILVKVDADMVFKSDLSKYMNDFYANPNDTHWSFLIYDMVIREYIPALHIYKNKHAFSGFSELKTDVFEKTTDRKITSENLLTHMESVDAFQCFRTGIYRAQRAYKTNTKSLDQYIEVALKNPETWLSKGIKAYTEDCNITLDYSNEAIIKLYINEVRNMYG